MVFMKKLFLPFVALVLVCGLCSCSKNMISLDACGIQLPIGQEYLDMGLSCDAYGTDMAIYPLAIIGFSYPDAAKAVYESLVDKYENLDNPDTQFQFYMEFEELMEDHQKLIAELAVIPTNEYEEIVKNPQPGYEFITDMRVLATKYGNTYLCMQVENTTEGMSAEEEQAYVMCRDKALKAIQKARFKKVKNQPPEENDFLGNNGSVAFPMFASMDLNGNSVTEEIFKKKDKTVLVLWNVSDGDPDAVVSSLSTWSETLPDDTQMVGIVCDINSPTEDLKINIAKDITEGLFTNIIGAGDLQSVGEYFKNLPTVFFVDGDGDLWGQPIENVTVADCAEMLSLWQQSDVNIGAMFE